MFLHRCGLSFVSTAPTPKLARSLSLRFVGAARSESGLIKKDGRSALLFSWSAWRATSLRSSSAAYQRRLPKPGATVVSGGGATIGCWETVSSDVVAPPGECLGKRCGAAAGSSRVTDKRALTTCASLIGTDLVADSHRVEKNRRAERSTR